MNAAEAMSEGVAVAVYDCARKRCNWRDVRIGERASEKHPRRCPRCSAFAVLVLFSPARTKRDEYAALMDAGLA